MNLHWKNESDNKNKKAGSWNDKIQHGELLEGYEREIISIRQKSDSMWDMVFKRILVAERRV